METKKKIKIITNLGLEGNQSSASLKNISSKTSFQNLMNLADFIATDESDAIGLYFNGREIDINETAATIEEIFKDYNEIIIEIKTKKAFDSKRYQQDVSTKNKKEAKYFFSQCRIHDKELEKYFCETCKDSLCFRCSIMPQHKSHQVLEKWVYYENKALAMIEKFEKISLHASGNEYLTSLIQMKNEHINRINEDFAKIAKKTSELKNFYIEFFSEYYNTLLEKAQKINKEIYDMSSNVQDLSTNISLNSDNFYQNIDKIQSTQRDIDGFFEGMKAFSDLTALKNEFISDYEMNFNSLFHRIELIQSELISDSKLSKYQELNHSLLENEDAFRKEILTAFCTEYEDSTSLIVMPIPLTKKILAYDHSKKEFTTLTINDKYYTNFKFYDYSRYVNYGCVILTTGGMDNEKELSSSFLTWMNYTTNEVKLVKLAGMKRERSQHALVYHPQSNLFFALSGYNNTMIEVYNPYENKWTALCSLTKARCNANVIFVDKYMYIFGGSDGMRYLSNSFERIDLSFPVGSKSLITFNSDLSKMKVYPQVGSLILPDNLKKTISLAYSGFGVIKLDPTKFLVVGGFNIESDSSTTDEIRLFEYDQSKLSFNISKWKTVLPDSTCFYYQEFIKFQTTDNGGVAYLYQFSANGQVIYFNPTSGEFNLIQGESQQKKYFNTSSSVPLI